MTTKTIRMIMAILLLGCISACAQNVELFGGYGYLAQGSAAGGRANLNGWAAGAEFGIPKLKHLSIAANFTGAYGTQNISTLSQSLHQFTYLVGPRVSQRTGRVRIFEHVMIGAAQLKGKLGNQSDSASGLAFALGVGADVRLNKHFSFRPAQFDYLLTRFADSRENNFKYSSGFVYRF